MKKKVLMTVALLLVCKMTFGVIEPIKNTPGYWEMTKILVYLVSSLFVFVYLMDIFPKQVSKIIDKIKIEIFPTLPKGFLGY